MIRLSPSPQAHIAPTSEYTYGDQLESVPLIVSSGLSHSPPPITEGATRLHAPSGLGDLAFEDAECARQEAFQQHQECWDDLTHNVGDAE